MRNVVKVLFPRIIRGHGLRAVEKYFYPPAGTPEPRIFTIKDARKLRLCHGNQWQRFMYNHAMDLEKHERKYFYCNV